ncbi:MAG: LysM peptidoglycan-binding domain-containing protein [Bacteroidales bacterium]|nr:LysM peptidoglycan-binding domain-containing protein [Bacteroidales bacterium]
MITRRLTILAISLALACLSGSSLAAQTYVAAPVTVSKEKVKNNGKVFYSHIVLEKQTLYGISKAYNVSVQEIYDANPTLDLENQGLKKNQIILIPAKDDSKAVEVPKPVETARAVTGQNNASSSKSQDDFFYHTAKWFEDLDAIAQKYGTTADVLMAFNGMKNKTISKKDKIKIPRHPENVSLPKATIPAEKQVEPEVKSDVAIHTPETETVDNTNKVELPEKVFNANISASLLLPFNAQGTVADNDMDFYSGVLLAIKDLGEEGISTDLNVYDVANSIPVTRERFAESDIVIGPVAPADINKALAICPASTYLVSPLDQKGEAIAKANSNVIQGPTPTESQYQDIINWIKQDHKSGDKVILISEKGAKSTAATSSLTLHMQQSGLQYSTISYGILEGRNIVNSLANLMSNSATNRVVIASESEAFVNDVVRNLNLLVHRKYNVVLYSPSKIRSFDTIDVEDFHNVNLHVSMSYFVDYSSPKVQSFLLAYRALFNTEPTPFSFQGYDDAYFFISSIAKYGKNWPSMISSGRTSGLQADFKFTNYSEGGLVNNAIRRIVYGSDYSITLLR